MEYKNLVLLGTSHIAEQSVEEVSSYIEEKEPEIIALELDRRRFYALTHDVKRTISFRDIFRVGVKGFIFALLGAYAEKKLGRLVGAAPGAEMKNAIKLAKENDIKIALIDQDIEITLRKFSRSFSWKEKWNVIVDIFKSLFGKGEVSFDLRTVPDEKIISNLIKKVKKRYPNVYKVLIEERNEIMARSLLNIMRQHEDKTILAVVGAGHKKEILGLVKKSHSKAADKEKHNA